jgi:hypothetical protein
MLDIPLDWQAGRQELKWPGKRVDCRLAWFQRRDGVCRHGWMAVLRNIRLREFGASQ